MNINEDVARKVLKTVDAGLSHGMGKPEPGQMCVEAAVCYALGLPHGDNPPCVGEAVRSYKIRLNDSFWSSDKARAKGMRRVAIAQLGSNNIDQRAFADYVVINVIARILAPVLAKRGFVKVAEQCAAVTTMAEAKVATEAPRKAAYAYAYADAADAGAAAADAAYADAAYADAGAAAAAAAAKRDEVLALAAEIAVEALQAQQCEGCQWLPA